MKFYREKTIDGYYWGKIEDNNLTAIYFDYNVWFFKDGKYHNNKNASYINYNGFKEFFLNSKYYGNEYNFTKKSWRKFVKLQVFL